MFSSSRSRVALVAALVLMCGGVAACGNGAAEPRALDVGPGRAPATSTPVTTAIATRPLEAGRRRLPQAQGATSTTAMTTALQVPTTNARSTTSTTSHGRVTVPTVPPLPTTSTLLPPILEPVDSVAYQLNPRHTGAHDDPDLVPVPLQRLWQKTFAGNASQPLIVGDVVYLVVSNPGALIYAFDRLTGHDVWGPVSLGNMNYGSSFAYDNGRLYVQNVTGQLDALDASTGESVWSTKLCCQYDFWAPPTAVGGIVYTTGAGWDGTLYAVDEDTGALRWSQHVISGGPTAVTSDGVYVATADSCDEIDKFDPLTGAVRWHHAGRCIGGEGTAPVVYGSSMIVNNFTAPGVIFDTNTGDPVRNFTSWETPAVAAGVMFTTNPTLSAQLFTGGVPLWNSSVQVLLPPIVVNGTVFVVDGSWVVHAVNALTGIDLWSAPLDDARPASNAAGGLAEGRGVLAVAGASTLTVFA